MNLEILITQSQKNLSDMDLEILAYVVKHQKQVQNANIIDLSKAVHVSKSSVLRMTKKLGFSGYTEFKYFLKQSDNDDKIAQTTDLIELQEKDIDTDIKGKNVLLIEDIIDSGNTLNLLKQEMQSRGAKTVKIASLLSKPDRRVVDIEVEYIGTDILDEFVVGYGLDMDEKYRQMDYIGILKPEIYM